MILNDIPDILFYPQCSAISHVSCDVQSHVIIHYILRCSTIFHYITWYSMIFDDIPWCSMLSAIVRKCLQYSTHDIVSCPAICHDMPRHSMHNMLWYSGIFSWHLKNSALLQGRRVIDNWGTWSGEGVRVRACGHLLSSPTSQILTPCSLRAIRA